MLSIPVVLPKRNTFLWQELGAEDPWFRGLACTAVNCVFSYTYSGWEPWHLLNRLPEPLLWASRGGPCPRGNALNPLGALWHNMSGGQSWESAQTCYYYSELNSQNLWVINFFNKSFKVNSKIMSLYDIMYQVRNKGEVCCQECWRHSQGCVGFVNVTVVRLSWMNKAFILHNFDLWTWLTIWELSFIVCISINW